MTATDGTPDAGTNLCCKEPTGPWNGGSMDTSKKIGSSGCSDTVSVTANGQTTTVTKYYQARIQAMPVYTEITVEDPWLETLNAVGGIIALIDAAFVLILSLTRDWFSPATTAVADGILEEGIELPQQAGGLPPPVDVQDPGPGGGSGADPQEKA